MPQIIEHPLAHPTLDNLADFLAREHARFSAAHYRAMSVFSLIETDLSSVAAERSQDMLASLQWGVEQDVVYSEAIPKLHELAQTAATNQLQAARRAVQVAAIALAHTGLDDLLLSLCRIAAVVKRDDILRNLGQRKVTIKEFRELSVQELEDKVIRRWLRKLRRDSLLEKWDTFLRHIPPPKIIRDSNIPYDRDRLDRFDEARHDAVHAAGRKLDALDLRRELMYVASIGMNVVFHVLAATDRKIDPRRMFDTAEFLYWV